MSLEKEYLNEMARVRMMNSALDSVFGPVSLEDPLIGVGDLPQDVQAGVEMDRDTGIGTKLWENAELTTEPCRFDRCPRSAIAECDLCCGVFCEKHLMDHNCPSNDEGTRLEE